MKNLTIKIAASIVVILSSFSLQSCTKESTITPVKAPAETPVPANKNTLIGKWRAVKGKLTIDREFIKGSTENNGTGNEKETTTSTSNIVNVFTAKFNWDITDDVLHFQIVADEFFIFELTENGNRLLLFDEINKKKVLAYTFERIN